MPITDRPGETVSSPTVHERCLPTFLVRRDPDGSCADACAFNQGRCLAGWRHPTGTVPWDSRCQDGDVYAFVRVAQGQRWMAAEA
jgi:hypothetical protein